MVEKRPGDYLYLLNCTMLQFDFYICLSDLSCRYDYFAFHVYVYIYLRVSMLHDVCVLSAVYSKKVVCKWSV